MRSRLSSVQLRYKLAALTLLPLMAMAWFQANAAIERNSERNELVQLNSLVELSVEAGQLLHEVQRERGATTIYLASEGKEFQSELEAQRHNSDLRYDDFVARLDENRSRIVPEVQHAIDAALDKMAELDTIRDEVTASKINDSGAITSYTNITTSLLDIFNTFEVASHDTQLSRQVTSYVAVVSSKELAGLERAHLSQVFETGTLTSSQVVTIAGLISSKDDRLDLFSHSASPKMRQLFESKQNNPIVTKVAAFESRALVDHDFTIDSAEWFAVITERIGLLEEIGNAQAEELETTSSNLATNANSAGLKSILIVVLVVIFTLVLVGRIARPIVKQLDLLSAQAERIADGDLEVEELNMAGADSIARLGGAFDRMSHTLHRISDQLKAVSDLELEDQSLNEPVPGELGSVIEYLAVITRGRAELEAKERVASKRTAELLEDVTTQAEELRMNSRVLQQTKNRFETLVHNSFEAILIIDEQGELSYLSSPFETVLGHKADDYLGLSVEALIEFVHPEEIDRARDQFRTLREEPGASLSMELRIFHADGSRHWVGLYLRNLFHDEAIQGMVINARDITERKKAAFELVEHAYHDELTGLPNRRLLVDRLEHALTQSSRHGGITALLFLDLDGFKEINDSMGHAAGDSLLVEVAERLQSLIRSGDTAARLGGDEFVILGEDLNNKDEVFILGNRVLESIRKPIIINDATLQVSASVGMVVAVDGDTDSGTMLRNADGAMYRVKQTGKDGFELHGYAFQHPSQGRLT